nr:hypothetical protein [Methanomethylovorans sp.]
TNRYYPDGEHVIYPYKHRTSYNIEAVQKKVIESTVQSMWTQYGYKSGELLKAESYKQNSPYMFNTIFQDFIQVVDNPNRTFTPIDFLISSSLDGLLSKFPQNDFPEIEDFYLEWDDTTRLALTLEDKKTKIKLIKELKNLFWQTFSKGVRLKINKNIPNQKIIQWEDEYQALIPQMHIAIEKIRESIILGESKIEVEVEEDIVKSIMQKAYYLDI